MKELIKMAKEFKEAIETMEGAEWNLFTGYRNEEAELVDEMQEALNEILDELMEYGEEAYNEAYNEIFNQVEVLLDWNTMFEEVTAEEELEVLTKLEELITKEEDTYDTYDTEQTIIEVEIPVETIEEVAADSSYWEPISEEIRQKYSGKNSLTQLASKILYKRKYKSDVPISNNK